MTGVRRRLAALFLLAAILHACSGATTTQPPVPSASASPSSPEPSVEPTESVTQTPQPSEPVVRDCPDGDLRVGCWSELTVPRTPRDEPNGRELSLDPFDGHPIEAYPVGTRLFIHDSAQDGDWWKVQVPPFEQRAGGDLFGWFALDELAATDTPECPGEVSRDTLATIEQPDRLACFGSQEIEVEGAVWSTSQWSTWGVRPDWFGDPESDRVFGLYETLSRGTPGRELPGGVPDGVDPVPRGVHVRVAGTFDHPEAVDCVREPENGEPIEEDPADSVTWCRQRFVVSEWDAIAGAEGRPYDETLQLHRQRKVEGEIGCDTIGIPYRSFTIRIDPDALVHVWADPDVGEDLFIFWEPTFAGGDKNDPVVRGPNGEVVARDGDVIDVDGSPNGIGGYRYCPGPSITVYDAPVD